MSGSYNRFGTYKGNGSATKREFPLGFVPHAVKIISVKGQAVLTERTPSAFKVLDTAVPALLGAAELKLSGEVGSTETPLGFTITSTDVVLNDTNVDYYWEAY